MKKLLAFLLIGSFLTGCASVSFAPADLKKSYAKRTGAQDIKLYRTEQPKGEVIEVGTLNGNGNPDKIIEYFREKASEQGGDAIISLEPYPGGYSATVIRMKD